MIIVGFICYSGTYYFDTGLLGYCYYHDETRMFTGPITLLFDGNPATCMDFCQGHSVVSSKEKQSECSAYLLSGQSFSPDISIMILQIIETEPVLHN